MFYDLNIPWTPTDKDVPRKLAFAQELGYNVIALNYEMSGKLPTDLTSPITPPQSPSPNLTILTRCTLHLSPTTSHQNARLASLARNYDLLALRPTDEKTLQQACTTLDCDIVSINLGERLGYWLQQKQKVLAGAVKEGKKIEICYAPGVGGGVAERRNLISNATQLIRATRGRGLVFSSEARGVFGLRGPWDVMNLATVWGLSSERAHEGLSESCRVLIRQAGLRRRGWRGVVDVVYGGEKEREGEAKEKVEVEDAVVGRKRKAGDGDAEDGKGEPKVEKPVSKREMKRRRKAELQAGGVENGGRGGEGMGMNGAPAGTAQTQGVQMASASGES